MNILVSISEGGIPTTTSRQIAEKFGKAHKNVLSGISELLQPNRRAEISAGENSTAIPRGWFTETTYLDAQGKPRPEYIITKDGFVLLTMGYQGKAALTFKLKYIQAFNQMESYIKSQQSNSGRELQDLREKVEQLQIHANLQLSAGYYQGDLPEYSVVGFAASRGFKFNNSTAIAFGKKAAALSKKKGARIGKIKDPRFGYVNLYRTDILKEVFRDPIF